MPDKPIKNGFKFWVLGASFSSIPIIWEFNQCKTDVSGFSWYIIIIILLTYYIRLKVLQQWLI